MEQHLPANRVAAECRAAASDGDDLSALSAVLLLDGRPAEEDEQMEDGRQI